MPADVSTSGTTTSVLALLGALLMAAMTGDVPMVVVSDERKISCGVFRVSL